MFFFLAKAKRNNMGKILLNKVQFPKLIPGFYNFRLDKFQQFYKETFSILEIIASPEVVTHLGNIRS